MCDVITKMRPGMHQFVPFAPTVATLVPLSTVNYRESITMAQSRV